MCYLCLWLFVVGGCVQFVWLVYDDGYDEQCEELILYYGDEDW